MSDLFVTEQELGIMNVHLISGEDIIGRVFSNTDKGQYRIERPMMPHIAPDQSGKYIVGLLPLRPYLGRVGEVVVKNTQVAYVVDCGKQMSDMWMHYTSDITLPTGGDLKSLLNLVN